MRVGQTGNNQVQGSETSAAKKTGRAHPSKAGEASAAAAETAQGADGSTATISSKAREASKAKEAAMAAPDVREEKIAELKRRIASGQYSVDANKVADKLVDEHLHASGMG